MQCTASKILARVSSAGVSYHTGNDLVLESTKILLSQFKGGCINLSKNDITGIATLCLDRPEKKNAISGKKMG